MKYRMYVDEVGNSDLGSSDNPIHRFLSLTGVIIEIGYVERVLHNELEGIKRKYFDSHPDDPVIFHRKEMINYKLPFEALRDEATRMSFDNELIRALESWQYTVVTVCIDKKKHVETYSEWLFDPYHYCLVLLLERFVLYLIRNSAVGDVMAESRGGKEDRRLKDSFHRLWKKGTDYISAERFQQVLTSSQLKVKTKSNNISGLQVADLVAHPSRNEILNEQDILPRKISPFAERIIRVLQNKYDQSGQRIFGKKFI